MKDLIGHGHDNVTIHAECSLASQKMMIYSSAECKKYKAIAKRIAGIPGWREDAPDMADLPDWPEKKII